MGVSAGAAAVGDRRDLAPRLQVSEIQRSRLFAATVAVVDRYGYSDATVSHITQCARISRRTFYELFENREECLAAMFEHAIELVAAELAKAELDGVSWLERMRGGLWAILSFLDREPTLARVCVVESLRGDEHVLERRTEVLAQLAQVVDNGRREGTRGKGPTSLTAEGLVGAAHAIVYARLLKKDPEPLTGLLGDLMGVIVLPYLGPEAARREQKRSAPAPAPRAPSAPGETGENPPAERNPLEGIPMRVTYRTALVLRHIAERPGISNRGVADRAGVTDQGQMSKLLSRLQGFGLIANTGDGHRKGEANAWSLTPRGRQVTQSILTYTPDRAVAA